MILQPRSLQQRTLFFILVPTLLLLVTLSVGGFLFVRDILLNQWGETAVVRLQRTAHLIDMELRKPKDLLSLLQSGDDGDANRQIFRYILSQVEGLEGVVGVNVEWPKENFPKETMPGMAMDSAMEKMHQYHLEGFDVGLPRYDSNLNNRTVSLVSEFINKDDNIVGRVEVLISFDTLIDQILNAPWWKSNKAYLIDRGGNVLISTALELELDDYFPMRWVRGGHDPAMVYSPARREFSELKGNGVALGVDANWSFEYNELPVLDEKQIILIGSDGAWDVENATGEQFGKERIKQILAVTSDMQPDEILQTIIEKIYEFRGVAPQNDDITLVVVKTC